MNSFFCLLKYDFINSYNINKLIKKKENIVVFIFIIVFVLYVIFNITNILTQTLKIIGMENYILQEGIIISSLLIFISSIYKMSGALFGIKDYDLLRSLPISKSKIILVKLINLVIPNYIIMIIFIIPSYIIYFINTNSTYIIFLYAIPMLIFIPLVPISIAAFIGIFIYYFSSKMKYKNLLTILLFFIIVYFIILSELISKQYIPYILTNFKTISSIINNIYPLSSLYTNALVNLNIIDMILFIIISLIIFSIFIYVASNMFDIINLNMKALKKDTKLTKYKFKVNGLIKSLVCNDLRRYFSIPTLVLNTGYGIILYLILSILTSIMGSKIINTVLGIPIMQNTNIKIGLILVIASFCIISANITSVSISLEGNKLWQIKTLPINEIEFFLSKIIMNLIIIIPILIIGTVLFSLSLKLSVFQLILCTIILIIISLLFIIWGIIINIKYLDLNWTSEISVIKRSTSVFITKLGGISLLFILTIIYLKININIINYLFFITIGVIAVTLLGIYILFSWGVNKFKKIII